MTNLDLNKYDCFDSTELLSKIRSEPAKGNRKMYFIFNNNRKMAFFNNNRKMYLGDGLLGFISFFSSTFY